MNGLLGMGGVRVVTGAAAAVLLLANMGVTPVLADTIDAALVRAYQNNPQLNAQRAQVRFTDENVPQALSGYRPRVAITASAGTQYTDTLTTSGGGRQQSRQDRYPWRQRAAQRRHHDIANGIQRFSNREPDPRGRETGLGSARGLAGSRTVGSALRRHDLHGLSARRGDRRGSKEQRSRARTDVEADPRPLQRRRSDPHRRRAVGGAAGRRPHPVAHGRIQSGHDQSEFPPHHRQRTRGACAGFAGRPLSAGVAAGGGRSRPDRKSQRHRGDVRHRCQLSSRSR